MLCVCGASPECIFQCALILCSYRTWKRITANGIAVSTTIKARGNNSTENMVSLLSSQRLENLFP